MKALLATVLALLAWSGAVGAKTQYLRSNTQCALNGDGSAYGCAGTAGGAGAYNSSANGNVQWGPGAGKVSVGDTLYVCGRITDFALVPSISGTAGNQITIDGLCPNDPGYVNGGGSNNFSIDITNKSYITVRYLNIGWAKRDALFVGIADSAGADQTDIYVLGNYIANIGATTLTNHCHAMYFNSITGTAALYRINRVRIIGNKFGGAEPVCAGSNNDDANLENLGTGAVITDNEASGAHEGFDISTGTGMLFERNYAHDNTHSGAKLHGIMGCGVGNRVQGNIFADNGQWALIWQDNKNGFVLNNTIKHAGVFHGFDIQSVNDWSGTCLPAGNTYANNEITADYVAGVARVYYPSTKAAFEAGNTWDGNALKQVGANTTLIYWNGEGSRANDITISNFDANWLPSHPKDQKQVGSTWAGGANPKTRNGFRLLSTSALKCAGTKIVGRLTDNLGRGFEPDCTPIGAMVYGRGDARATALTPRP